MWDWAALMPHAPILHKEIAGPMLGRCLSTVEGIKKLVSQIDVDSTSYIFLVDPHAYYYKLGYLAVELAQKYEGSLANFGAPELKVEMEGPGGEGESILNHIKKHISVSVHSKEIYPLDHGAVVPLVFLNNNRKKLPRLILVNPIGLSLADSYSLGKILRSYISNERWGLLASGDLSHTLTPDAPAGYAKEGAILDRAVVSSLKNSSPEPIFSLNERVIVNAGECGLRSVLIMLGLISGEQVEVLSYEGPFGVGYCTALWKRSSCDKEGC